MKKTETGKEEVDIEKDKNSDNASDKNKEKIMEIMEK